MTPSILMDDQQREITPGSLATRVAEEAQDAQEAEEEEDEEQAEPDPEWLTLLIKTQKDIASQPSDIMSQALKDTNLTWDNLEVHLGNNIWMTDHLLPTGTRLTDYLLGQSGVAKDSYLSRHFTFVEKDGYIRLIPRNIEDIRKELMSLEPGGIVPDSEESKENWSFYE